MLSRLVFPQPLHSKSAVAMETEWIQVERERQLDWKISCCYKSDTDIAEDAIIDVVKQPFAGDFADVLEAVVTCISRWVCRFEGD